MTKKEHLKLQACIFKAQSPYPGGPLNCLSTLLNQKCILSK